MPACMELMTQTLPPEPSPSPHEDAGVVWAQCLDVIRESVTNQAFKTWFEPTRPIKLDGTTLTIQVPSQFFYEWIEEHYYALVRKTIVQILGERAHLVYRAVVDESLESPEERVITLPSRAVTRMSTVPHKAPPLAPPSPFTPQPNAGDGSPMQPRLNPRFN